MEKSHHSSAESAAASADHYLKHLNKLSHKISKPPLKKHPLDPLPDQPDQSLTQSPAVVNQNQAVQQLQAPPPPPPPPQPPQQPPVYNINKNDFRDVVQKLTGSTAHERAPTPPPQTQQQQQQQPTVQAPKPPSSRLHRIRPPPLAQLINRPSGLVPPQQQQSSMLNPNILHPMNSLNATISPNHVIGSGFNPMGRPVAPLSPLPPLPSVHAAAESPVSAYMRRLQSSMAAVDPRPDQFTGFGQLAPLASPRWSNLAPPPPQPQQPQPQPQPQQQQQVAAPGEGSIPPPPEPAAQLQLPPYSPMPFGCLNSPRSAYPPLSPGFLFSPTSGQLGFPQLPLSPTVPVPSPRDRGL